jgi:hypothetical protein
MASTNSDAVVPAVVRTYRQGLGDCHLVSLRVGGAKVYRILIDCGVALPTENAAAVMNAVMEDVLAESGGKVDVLVATHEHWDHLSGFLQAARPFGQLEVGEVWMGWTEDPNDAQAQSLREERASALDKLRLAGARMQLQGSESEATAINSVLGFFGAAGRASTRDALEAVRAKSAIVRYCQPGDPPIELPGLDARVYVLGPPRSEASLRKLLPSKHYTGTYRMAQEAFANNVVPALEGKGGQQPFNPLYAIPEGTARGMPFFQRHYWDSEAWRRIDSAWVAGATQFALALDSVTNNTSLVLAIEVDGLGVLLFPADAQLGSWLSWGGLHWQVAGKPVGGNDLLARTVFYKVGHHGSFNATLSTNGLALMERLRVAVIPVDHAMAMRLRWGEIPLQMLEQALEAATRERGYVLRTDQEPSPLALERGARAAPGWFEVPLLAV